MLKNIIIICAYFLAALGVEIFLYTIDPVVRGIKYGVFIIAGIIIYNLVSEKLARKFFWIALSVAIAVVCAVPVALVHKDKNIARFQEFEQDIEEYRKNPTDAAWSRLTDTYSPETDIEKDDVESLEQQARKTVLLRDNTEIKLGTDLHGGFEIMYEVLPVEGRRESSIDEGTLDIIRQRINNSGLTGNTVQSVGKNRILVQVPGYNREAVDRVKGIIKKRGHLAFRLVSSNNLLVDKYTKIKQENEKARIHNRAHPNDPPKQLRPYPEGYELLELTEIVERDGEEKKRKELLLVETKERLTGDDLSNVYKIQTDEHGRPAVGLDFTLIGRKRMARVTGNNKGERLAIALDGELKSAPKIQQKITRSARITGDFTHEEVDSMIDILRAGSLDIKMKELSEYSVEASLGRNSIENGIRSILYALIVVLIFMCAYYLKAGCIADATLLCNLILIIGGLSLFQITLTLPGIAGLLLTVGMSVDANIIIFERIREEIQKRRTGKDELNIENVTGAVDKGYQSAFWTIFDANITTLITALILLIVGTGAIKGFAITLSIGIIGSMLSALVISKVFFQTVLASGWFKQGIPMLSVLSNPAFTFVADKIKGGKDGEKGGFFLFQWKFQTMSCILILVSAAVFFMRGESKYGVDFTGGSITKAAFSSDITAEDLRESLSSQFPHVKVQKFSERGSTRENEKRKTFSIFLPTENEREKIVDIFRETLGSEPASAALFTVSPEQQKDFNRKEWTAFSAEREGRFILANPRDTEAFMRSLDEAYIIRYTAAAVSPKKVLDKLPLGQFSRGAVHSSDNTIIMVGAMKKDRERLKEDLEQKFSGQLAPEGFESVEKDSSDVFTVSLQLTEELKADQVRSRLTGSSADGISFSSIEIQEVKGTSVKLKLMPEDENITAYDITETLKSRLPVSRRYLGDNAIGSTVASELRERGIIAIILALIAIVIYITIRFEFNFSIGAVTALVHDVALTIGIVVTADSLGLVPVKIDLTILAAILTIIGYSLNDTIVVFDRIREHFPLKDNRHQKSQSLPRARIAGLIDEGINGTLSRTILTSLTTLLVTLCLLFFGGGVIQGFAFALTVGVIVGTYSSVFIASPVVLLIHWLRDKKQA